jgi:pimeloyl-ACP methyl ester carboxylesterase
LWDRPETAYAKAGDVHVAYQVLGDGPQDLVLVSAWFSHVEARWEMPGFAYYLRRLASFSRLISFDKRGIGLSDPVPLERLPLLEEWMDDVRTVMDAVASERAVVMGANEGSMMAALFAATYPDRVSALVLANATARVVSAHDHPWGIQPDVAAALIATVDESWGEGATMAAVNPTIAGDREAIQEWGRFQRLAASPSVAAAVIRMLFELDVRAILPTIRVPTLVVSRRDALFAGESGRAVADLIPGARFVVVPGVDYGLAVGDVDVVIDEVEQFVTGSIEYSRPFSSPISSTRRRGRRGSAIGIGARCSTHMTSSPAARCSGTAVASSTSPVTASSRRSTGPRARCAARLRFATVFALSVWRSGPASTPARLRDAATTSPGSGCTSPRA